MKKILAIFLFIFSYALQLRGQTLAVDWTRFIGQSTGCCVILNSAIPTRDGGIVFTGSAGASDTTNGDIPPTSYGGVLACKVDSNANILWIHEYGGAEGVEICETQDGGYAILAYTGDIGLPDGDITGYKGNGDIWLLRIDSTGNFLWGNCYGSDSANEQALSIAVTNDNGFILLGISNGSGQDVPFHLGGSEFEYDWFVVKTDSHGNKEWADDLGGSNDEAPNNFGTILEGGDCYYLVSTTSSVDYDCTDTAWHPGVNTLTDYYIIKLNTTGNVLWSKSFGGTRYDELKSAVWDKRDSTILVTGSSSSNDYMVTGNPDGNSMWTIKVGKNGNLVWENSLGGIYGCGGICIAINPDSGYVILAGTSGVIGNSDVWMFLVNDSGNVVADKIFGGTGSDGAACAFPYKHGYIATGTSLSYSFTDGANYGRRGAGDECFISYLGYAPASVKNDKGENRQLLAYPNPTDGLIRIIPETAGNGTISVNNIVGQKVFEEKTQRYIDVTTEGWANGIYIVKWQGEDGTVLTTRLIKY